MKRWVTAAVAVLLVWNVLLTAALLGQTDQHVDNSGVTVINHTINGYTTDVTEVLSDVRSSLVTVRVTEDEFEDAFSGVIYEVREDGCYILTTASLVRENAVCSVRFDSGIELTGEIIGREDLAQDERYSTYKNAREHKQEIIEIFDEWFRQHPWSEVDQLLTEQDIVHTKIMHFSDVANDPQARANGYVYDFTARGGKKEFIVSTPVKFGKNEACEHKLAPLLGEHTEEILTEFGFSADEIRQLEEDGSVKQRK